MSYKTTVRSIFAILFVLSSYSFAQIPAGYEEGLKVIRSGDFKEYISYLASDELKGRAAGTEENMLASKFIANRFLELQLKPFDENRGKRVLAELMDDDDSPMVKTKDGEEKDYSDLYFQKFFILETRMNENSGLKVNYINPNITKELSFQFASQFVIDYRAAQNLSVTAPLVFLGYGIDKTDWNYSDYKTADGKDISVKDKIVFIIEGYPQESDPNSQFNKNLKGSSFNNTKRKAAIAYEKGALAVIVYRTPLKENPPFAVAYEAYANMFTKKQYTLPELNRADAAPIIYVDNTVASALLEGSFRSLKRDLQKLDSTLKPISYEVKEKTVSVDIKFHANLIPSQNIVGYIEGTDPELKKEYIVVGAHFDHVGLGHFGAMNRKDIGKIHNGADDNASGTAAVLEIAEAFTKNRPKRSVIFIAFNAEEMGLLGSRYYAYQNPFKKINATKGMVNLDMIGRNESKLVWAGGIFYSSDMKKVVEEANTNFDLEVLYNVGLLTFASDQGPFIKKEIPAIFFHSGLHDEYHTPLDDAEKIDFEKATKITKLAFVTSWILANTDNPPAYRALSNDEKAELVKESMQRMRKYRPETKKNHN
ncbi:MAG: M20/M25/M40 family metallo-hydrolase [Ignavibacteriaceae bacterium]|nr:M20/M25/M40 family metallo-hydrolase [Ignavibacteriaceae bacterium]